MDTELAEWLTELIAQTFSQLDHKPGLTAEVRGESKRWVQIVPDIAGESGKLAGVLLNFAFPHGDDPLSVLKQVGLKPPPDTEIQEWEPNGFARMWIRSDIPVVALALFVGDIIEKVVGAPEGYELQAWIEYGY